MLYNLRLTGSPKLACRPWQRGIAVPNLVVKRGVKADIARVQEQVNSIETQLRLACSEKRLADLGVITSTAEPPESAAAARLKSFEHKHAWTPSGTRK